MNQATTYVTRYWSVKDWPVVESYQFIYDPLDPRAFPLPEEVWAVQEPTITAALADGPLASFDSKPIYDNENLWVVMWRAVEHGSSSENPVTTLDDEDLIFNRDAQGAIDDWDMLSIPVKNSAVPLTFEQYTALVKNVNDQNSANARKQFDAYAKAWNERREVVAAATNEQVANAIVGEPTTGPEAMYAALGDI